MIPYYNGLFMFYPFLQPNCNLPPTIYTILESIVNPDVDLNEPAPEVKIKDLEHNMDTSRLDVVTKKDQERVKKYIRCHNYLTEIDNK